MPKTKRKTKSRKKPVKIKTRGLTAKQINYKKLRLGGYSKYSAARLAGYAHSTAISAKSNIDDRMPSFDKELEMAGLTDKALAQHIKNGLEATKVQACQVLLRKNKGGGVTVVESSSEFVEVPDHQVRHKYLETILRDRGLAKMDKGPLVDNSEHTHLTIVVQKEDEEDPIDARAKDNPNEATEFSVALTD